MKIYPGMLCKIVGSFIEEDYVTMFDCENQIEDFYVKKGSLALVLTKLGDGMLILLTSTNQIGTIHNCVCDIIG